MTENSKLTMERHNTLNSPAEEWTVNLLWTPGHWGNEIADHLTKLVAGQAIVGLEPAVEISNTQWNYLIQKSRDTLDCRKMKITREHG